MADPAISRKLAVIVHADVVSSTALVQRDETLAHKRINAAFQRFSSMIPQYNGTVHEIRGDALVAEFARASDAVCAALLFQQSQTAHNAKLDDDVVPIVRIGIALGEEVFANNTVTGAGVVLAQRVEQLSAPGGVCVTGAIHEAIPQRMPFDQESLGEQDVKGFDEPVRVYRVALKPGEAVPEAETSIQVRSPSQTRRLIVAFGAVALIVAIGVIVWLKPWAPQWELHDKPSIVVLPFTSMSDESDEEHFADGMTDDLITDLSRISGLFVIARNTSFTYKGEPVNVPQMAEELGVRYVLEGSVRRAGGKIRINAQLIDAATGGHLWAERYDSDGKDIFSLQNQVISRIATALEVTLTDTEKSRLARIPTRNLEAYDYFQRAKRRSYLWGGRNRRAALSLYQKALELDPEFSEAYAGVADTASQVWRWGLESVLPGPVARKLAFSAASKALALDPGNAQAYSVLAWSQLVEGEHEQAMATARQGVSLQASPHLYAQLAGVLIHSGRHAEALSVMEEALQREPKPPPAFHGALGWVLFWNGEYEKALEHLETALEGGVENFTYLAMTYAELGRLEEANATVERLRGLSPHYNLAWVRGVYTYYRRAEDLEHHLGALRKAGVPEWPFGFQGREEDRLEASAIYALTHGRTWTGRDVGRGGTFIQEFDEQGNVIFKGLNSLLTGTATVEGDTLCIQFPARNVGRKQCSYLYRNPEGTPEDENEYVMVADTAIWNFSIKP